MNIISKNRTIILFSFLCLLTIGFGFFEWIHITNSPKVSESTVLAKQSVDRATDNFQQFVFDFTNNSTAFTEFAKSEIRNGNNAENLSFALTEDYQFWGTTIFKEGNRWFWDGYDLAEYPNNLLSENKALFISIGNENNVTFLYSIIPFYIEQDSTVVRYDVYNRIKLSQDNILNIGSNLELNPEYLFSASNNYPIHFTFNGVFHRNSANSSILSTVSADSIGQVFALESDFKEYQNLNQTYLNRYRSLFLLSFIFVIGALIFSISHNFPDWKGLLIKGIALSFTWLLTHILFLSLDLNISQLSSFLNKDIFQYTINAIYFSFIAFSVYTYVIHINDNDWQLKTRSVILLSALLSVSIGVVAVNFLQSTSNIIANTTISISDLEPIPSVVATVVYFCAYLFFSSFLIVSVTLIWKLLKVSYEKKGLIIFTLLVGFLCFLIVTNYSLIEQPKTLWIPTIASLYFILVLIISSFLLRWTPSFLRLSNLRLLLFISFLATCFIYMAFTNGSTVRQDKRILNAAFSYSVDQENEMQNIAVNLLKELSFELSKYPESAFNDNYLDQLIEGFIQPEWLRYTLSVQVINESGDRFSDYTTSLSAPQWTTAFRVQELEIPYIVEQIRRESIRPIIRYRPINTINANYSSFIRAWIPIFKNTVSNERIGWILCSIYEELPQLDRPLRTVIFSGENNVFGETFTASEYKNGIFVRSSITGTPLEIPGPNILSTELINSLNQDSVQTTSFQYENDKIKELYLKKGDKTIVRVATKKTELKQHVFSFLRLFFVLVIIGIFLTLLSRNSSWQILSKSRRFKDRLIDRFIIASIACLLVLIGSSYYVLNNQNKEDVLNTLFERLENLATSLENDPQDSFDDIADLQRISSTLDVDAALYQDGMLVNSTTAQIFTQHLLPSSVPWDIYQRIINKKSAEEISVVKFEEQEMVIGYKPWFDATNQIAGIAAIPTFLKAPKFYDRLLSTTSLLLAFYTFIFGLLMVIIGLISSQLTSPLEQISDGLQRISDGDLETILPVKSDDEIGMLTLAYNNMAKKLKSTLKELAKSEREAAWKEMAQQIAHEIKNPLTPMKLNLQHLERQMNMSNDAREDVKPKVAKITASMIEQIDALNQIASEFSKFAKPIEHEFQKLDLNYLVQSVIEMYDQDQNFSLELSLSKSPLYIFGAKDELRRILVNLIKNASEALTDKGEIKVQTLGDSKRAYAQLTISDNGGGISEEDQDKIFVPNFSTKSSGTGLGLAITKKIIEEHNGTISFTSEVGKGTTFTIQIPQIKM